MLINNRFMRKHPAHFLAFGLGSGLSPQYLAASPASSACCSGVAGRNHASDLEAELGGHVRVQNGRASKD